MELNKLAQEKCIEDVLYVHREKDLVKLGTFIYVYFIETI